MLSVSSIGNASGAASYYGKDDYYVTGEADAPGLTWGGGGAEMLGLSGRAEAADFKAILNGAHPRLHTEVGAEKGDGASGATSSQEAKGGKSTPTEKGRPSTGHQLDTGRGDKHRAGWDLTFSAPKSISIAILVGGDKRLDAAHDRAVAAAMDYAERHFAITRARDNGRIRQVDTGNLVYAQTVHGTSREGDPQRHTHVVVANATVERETGKVRALESLELFKHRELLGRIYQQELAKGAIELGYNVKAGETKGTFEIGEWSREQLKALSKRRTAIEAAIALEKPTTPVQKERLVLRDRPRKLNIPRSELVDRWREEASAHGIDAGRVLSEAEERGRGRDVTSLTEGRVNTVLSATISALSAIDFGPGKQADPYGYRADEKRADPDARKGLSIAIRTTEQQKAVFSKHELVARAMNVSRAGMTASRIEREITSLQADGRLARADAQLMSGMTSDLALRLERTIAAAMEAGRCQAAPVYTKKEATARFDDKAIAERESLSRGLSTGQRAAAEMITSTRDRYVAVQGFAGVGKTTLFRVLKPALEEKGRAIEGIAPTHAAVRAMQSEANIRSSTVEAFLRKNEAIIKAGGKALEAAREQWTARTLMADEASMLSNQSLYRLTQVVDALKIKNVILVGDERQLGSPQAGAPFRLLLNEKVEQVRITEIQRQRPNPELLGAVKELAVGNAGRGLKALESYTIQVGEKATDLQLGQAAASAWSGKKNEGKHVPVIVPTHALRGIVSGLIRNDLQERGELAKVSATVERLYHVRMVGPERHLAQSYEIGQRLVMNSAMRDAGLKRGDEATIVGKDMKNDRLIVERADGKTTSINLARLAQGRNGAKFETYTAREVEVAQGERMVWERTDAERGFMIGVAFTVLKTTEKEWTIRHDSGKVETLSANDRALKFSGYAYAETADRSQGRTYSEAIGILASAHGQSASLSRFYVEASRNVHDFTFVTNDTRLLAMKLGRQSGMNPIALESLPAAPAGNPVVGPSIEPTTLKGQGLSPEPVAQSRAPGEPDGLKGRDLPASQDFAGLKVDREKQPEKDLVKAKTDFSL